MLGTLVRKAGDLVFRRANARLAHAGVRSEWAYVLALASAGASSAAFLGGFLTAGLVLLVLHGFFDYLDGGLRRARGRDNRRPQWLGIDAHALVDKASEVVLFAAFAGGGWVGWPLALGTAITSVAVTLVGRFAKNRLDLDPGRVLFDRSDRLFVLLVAGAFRAFSVALALVCAMNGVILLQRLRFILLTVRARDRTA